MASASRLESFTSQNLSKSGFIKNFATGPDTSMDQRYRLISENEAEKLTNKENNYGQFTDREANDNILRKSSKSHSVSTVIPSHDISGGSDNILFRMDRNFAPQMKNDKTIDIPSLTISQNTE